MIEQVNSYILEKYNIKKEAKILVAVSGGVDSMVLLHYLSRQDFKVAVAHVNHSTRNGESDEDQLFVEAYCNQNVIPFYAKKLTYEKLKRGNFQENARNARYAFFMEIMNKHKFDFIATAHHADDQWETFILNLVRGSGLQGLKGIREQRGKIIRPFLSITKEEIKKYQEDYKIPYVEDSTNSDENYMRNRVRHRITPVINGVFPHFVNQVTKSTKHLRSELNLLQELVDQVRSETFEEGKKKTKIKLKGIQEYKHAETLLYYLLQPYGFDRTATRDMLHSKRTGALFQSKDYEVLHDRKKLILRKRSEKAFNIDLTIDDLGSYTTDACDIALQRRERDSVVEKHLLLDPSKIEFPLKIRTWKAGDKLRPAGMNGNKKKVKNFLTDLKLNRFEKENVLVIEKDETIIQIVGFRTAEGYIAEGDVGIQVAFSIDN